MTDSDLRRWFNRKWSSFSWIPRVAVGVPLPGRLAGVYCLAIWRGGAWDVLYIGKSVNVRARLQGHAGRGLMQRSEAFEDWISEAEEDGGVPCIWTREIPSPSERAKAEIEAIHALRPRWNVRDVEGECAAA